MIGITRQSLLDYMQSKLGLDPHGVDDDTPLFSSNLLDSFSMVNLIAFVESQGELRMDTWDVTLDNLDSINRILKYANTKAAAT